MTLLNVSKAINMVWRFLQLNENDSIIIPLPQSTIVPIDFLYVLLRLMLSNDPKARESNSCKALMSSER